MRRFVVPYGRRNDPFLSMFFDPTMDGLMTGFDKLGGKLEGMVSGIKSDIKETETSYIVDAELPGYSKEDIKVELSDGILTISAETKKESEESKDNFVRKERYVGKTCRSYSFDDVDEENIKAKYENGILTIELLKIAKKEPKKNIVIE